MRSFDDIAADIAALERQLEALHIERADAYAARREAIIKAFDDGATRAQIVAEYGITYERLSGLLTRTGRTEKQRQSIGLSGAQATVFHRLVRQKVGARAARKIAEAVAT